MDTHKYGYALKGTSVLLYAHKELRHAQYFCYADWTGEGGRSMEEHKTYTTTRLSLTPIQSILTQRIPSNHILIQPLPTHLFNP